MAGGFGINSLLNSVAPVTRKIFVSYHHDSDKAYYKEFARFFSVQYEAVEDNSVDRLIDSFDPQYVMRRIRENHITGSSCTVVLCGPETRWRKYVDWEIKATLDKNHGLIGVLLPNNPPDVLGRSHKPDRLQDNIDSGYAVWTSWSSLSIDHLRTCIESANAKVKSLIRNDRIMRLKNGV